MKKTQHQSFIDELHKQITCDSVKRTDSLQKQERTVEDEKEDIFKEPLNNSAHCSSGVHICAFLDDFG